MPSLIIHEGASSEPTTEAIQQSERSVKQEKRYSFTPSSSPPDPTVKPRSASVLVSPRVRQFQLHDYDSIHFAKKKLSVASSDGTFSAESAGESPKSSTTGPSSAVNGPFLTGPLAKEFRHPEPFDILSPRSRERDEIRKIDLHATGLLFPPAPAFSSSNEMEFYHLSYLPDQQIHSCTSTINHTMQCNTSESEAPAEHKDSSSLHVSHQESAASIHCALQETVEYETLARHSDEKVTHQSDPNVFSSSTFQLSSHDELSNRASIPVTARTINDNEPFDNEFGEQRVVSSIVARDVAFHDTFDRVTVGMLDAMKSLLPHTDEKMTHAQVELTCIVRKVQTQLEILNSASQRIRTDFEQNTRRLVQTSEEKRFAEAKVEHLEQMIEQVKKERDSLQQQLSQSQGKENQFIRSTLSNFECCISDSRIQSLDLLSSLQKDVTSLYSAVGAIPSLVEKIDEIQKAQAEAHTTFSRVRSTNFEDIMHRNHSDTNSTKGSDSSGGTNWRLYITVVLVGVTFWCITLSSIYILFQYALMPQMHQQGKFTGVVATKSTQNSMIQASMSGIKVSDPFLHHDGESSGDEMCIADPERFNPTATSCSGIVAKKTLPIKNMDSEQLEGRYQATNDDDVSKSHVSKDEQILQSKLQWQQTLFIALGHFHDQFFSQTKSHLLNFKSSWSWHPDLSEQLFRALGRLTHALKALTGTYSSIINGNVTKHEISGDGMSGELVNNQPDNLNPESDNTSIDSLLNVHSNSSIATLMHSFVNEEDSEANLTRRSTHTVSQILVDGLRNKNTKVNKGLGLSEEGCTEKNPICTWYDFFTIYTVPVKISAVKDQADRVYDLNKMGSKKSVVSHVKIRTTWDNKSICSFSDQPVSHRLPDDTFSPRSYDQRTTNVKAAMRGDKLALDEGSDDQALPDKSNAISALKGQNLDDIWRGEGLDKWQSVNVYKTTLQKDLSSASAEGDEEESSQIVEKRFDSDGSSTAMSLSGETEQSYCPLKTPFPTNAKELCSTSSPALVSETELSGAPITKPIGAIGNLAASLVSMVRDPDQH